MADYTKNARSLINSFLWSELKSNLILDENDYYPDGFTKSIVPIVPIQQIPEMNNLISNKPYIVYDYDVMNYGDMWWVCEERMIYTVISDSVSEVSQISEFLVDLFRRKDLSGKDMQAYNTDPDIVKFYSICLESVSSPEPFDLESGRMAGTVEITYKYSREVDADGRYV